MVTYPLQRSRLTRSGWRWVALLVLFGLPLGCDQSPTAPHPLISTSLLAVRSLTPPTPVFDSSQYFGIDMNWAAAVQYCTVTYVNYVYGIPVSTSSFVGPGCSAVQVGNGLYGWAAKTPNSGALLPIDLKRAVADQYGAGYVLGAVGVGAYDWRAVHWAALSNDVLPVMVVSEDYFNDVLSVAVGREQFKTVLASTWKWYAAAMASHGGPRETFRLLQPLVVFNQSPYNAAQWNTWSAGEPGIFTDMAWNAYGGVYPYSTLGSNGASLRVLISVFTGNSPTVFGGAGYLSGLFGSSVIPAYAVVPPATSSLSCSSDGSGLSLNRSCNEAAYWVGHELGSTFGLQECTASSPVECQYTIMEVFPPAEAPNLGTPDLMQTQITTLANSGFFFAQ